MYEDYVKAYRNERRRTANNSSRKVRAAGPFLPGDEVLVYNQSKQKTEEKWLFPPNNVVRRVGMKHYELDDGKVHHEYNLKRYFR
jgi:hypothetical protein